MTTHTVAPPPPPKIKGRDVLALQDFFFFSPYYLGTAIEQCEMSALDRWAVQLALGKQVRPSKRAAADCR